MKKILLVLLVLGMASLNVLAATSDSAIYSGSAPAVNELTLTESTDLGSTLSSGLTAKSMGSFAISNNDVDGFTITITSTNGGYLKRATTDGSAEANHLDYTIDVSENGGTLGAATLSTKLDLSLSTAKTIVYNQTITQPSALAGFDVSMTASSKALWAGTFSDTVTFEVANN